MFFHGQYETLRNDVIAELGKTCNRKKCGKRAFEHQHLAWVAEYAEWLVKIAVVSDWLFNDAVLPRTAASWMRQFPPERMEAVHAQRRAA